MPFGTQISRLVLASGVMLLLILAVFLGYKVVEGGEQTTFNFIALVIIFMTSLTLSAVVFQGLRMSNKHEAFGLPSGSIRALLAIGIMILLVVFGLPLIQPARIEGKPLQIISVSAETRGVLIAELRAQNLVPVTTDMGKSAGPGDPPGADRPAKIAVFATSMVRSQQDAEFGKQLITAIITLLTSVVSFYFGAKSVAEATQSPSAEDLGPAPMASADLKRKTAIEALNKIDTEIGKVNAALDELKANPTFRSDHGAELASAAQIRGEVERKRDDLRELLGTIGTDIAKGRVAAGAEQHTIDGDVDNKLNAAIAALGSLEKQHAEYANQVAQLYRLPH